jgi:hypothetical protein
MNKTGLELIAAAEKYIGRPYVFGVVVPKDDEYYQGAFDCAELVAKAIFDVTGKLYGCSTSDVTKATKADAYTGYIDRDATLIGTKISVEDGARIPGAIMLRVATGSAIGHTSFSKGDGNTVEARGAKYGVVKYKVSGRDWDYAILLPFVDYSKNDAVPILRPLGKLIKLVTPFLIDIAVGLIQNALKSKGIYKGNVDNHYGPLTQAAVVKFQKQKGLTPDGQLISGGDTAKALGILI